MKVDESEMAELLDVQAFRGRLDGVLERLKDSFIKQYAVRTSIGELQLGEMVNVGRADMTYLFDHFNTLDVRLPISSALPTSLSHRKNCTAALDMHHIHA